MSVYEFEKSLLVRLEESTNVLQCKSVAVPASEVRDEWAYHVELQIEPAGWQALWKIPRPLCEELSIKYPTIVGGTVSNVYFKELRAEFVVSAVQDDDVHIPEMNVVALEDLWPTREQEIPELNVDRTADCIDQLRFFYKNIWMPWDDDNDDDLDWFEKHLKSRIRFCFDLKRGMSRSMADHIRTLLTEARYIQGRQELLQNELEESDIEDIDTSKLDRNNVTDLMKLHLRMAVIKNEIELLENPDMRKMYEEVHFQSTNENSNESLLHCIVSRDGTIAQQINYFQSLKNLVPTECLTKIYPTLQDCLNRSSPAVQIYVSNGLHNIKCGRTLYANGSIKAVLDDQCMASGDASKEAIIAPIEDESVLCAFSGDYTVENLTFDCRNVRTALWIRSGSVTLRNCFLFGDGRSATGIGVRVSNGASVSLENCRIQKFSSGLCCEASARVTISNSVINNCHIGMEFTDETNVNVQSTTITNSHMYGALCKSNHLNKNKKTIVTTVVELKSLIAENQITLNFEGDFTFDNNQKGNILVVKDTKIDALQNSDYLEDSMEIDAPNNEKLSLNGSNMNGVNIKSEEDSLLSHTSSDQDFHDASLNDVDFNKSIIVIE